MTNPAYQNIQCVDISINGRGEKEDEIYALHPKYEKNFRRGNTYLEVYDAYDSLIHTNNLIARKGLMKFYDLKQEYLVADEDFKQSLLKKKLKDSKARAKSNIRNYIFSPPINALH